MTRFLRDFLSTCFDRFKFCRDFFPLTFRFYMLPGVWGALSTTASRRLLPPGFRGSIPLSAFQLITFLCHCLLQNRSCLFKTGQSTLCIVPELKWATTFSKTKSFNHRFRLHHHLHQRKSTGLRSPLPRPSPLWHEGPKSSGSSAFFPSACCQQHRSVNVRQRSRHSAMGTPGWCPRQVVRHQREATRGDGHRRPGTARSMSRSTTFVVTRAPPSRQMHVAAHSTAKPRLPNTPALAHEAR